jgi:hypothetical protein
MRTRRYYMVRSTIRWTCGITVFWIGMQMLFQVLDATS